MSGTGRRVAVIGGGIAGLASAALLAADGYDVELFEQRPEVGGRAGSLSDRGFRFDTGPSWYLMPEVFDHFFRMLGSSSARELDLRVLDPAYRVFYEGAPGEHDDRPAPLDVSADTVTNLATFEQVEPGAGAQLTAYLNSSREAYDVALRHFLYTSFSSPRGLLHPEVVRLLPRLLPLLLRSLESFVAARFEDVRLRQVLGYPAVFLGSSPDRTPSLYHLMSALDLTGGVMYPQGGFTQVIGAIARLATEHGVRIRTGATVVQVTTEEVGDRGGGLRGRLRRGPRARATGLRWRDAEGQEHAYRADLVVGAGDLHHLETRLLPDRLRTYPQRWWDRRSSGPGAVLVLLGVRGELPQLPHHSLFFTHDWHANFDAIFAGRVPSPASAYVCKPSATDPSVAPADHENLFVLVPVPADPGLGRGGADGSGAPTVEAVADVAVDQVARWAGVPDLADRVVVRHTIGPGDFAADLSAWSGGMLGPGHTLRQSAMFRARNRSRHVAGLYYAGSSTIPGIGLPMCLISAELVLKHLRGDTSAGASAVPTAVARARSDAGPDAAAGGPTEAFRTAEAAR